VARSRRLLTCLTVAASLALMVFGLGSRPARAATPPPNSPINHIVVLMQENRSFDSYFGQLHFEGQPAAQPEPNTGNPNPLNASGPPIKPFHKTNYCETSDLNHSWQGTHHEWNNGLMDGFTTQNDINSDNSDTADPTGRRTMGYYDQSDLPFYYGLANTFAVGERYFASVLGPTFPNRFYLYAGTSFGHIANDIPAPGGYTQPTILRLLSKAGISWKIYYSQVPFAGLFSDFQQHPDHGATIDQYYADAKAGTLPQVAFVDPIFIGSSNTETDEHPPSNIQVGEQFSASVINSLMGSPNWHDSALFFTYDEHGGFYDHTPPPAAPVPDNIPPPPGSGPWTFNNYGIRVPAIVVSPFSKPHFVSDAVNDHASILRFIELRFGLSALTNRDAQANPMLEFFDFAHGAFSTPPTLPPAPVDPAHALQCQAQGGAQTSL
jgi:phospholipase C